ncbi:hypothetical protein ZIOFF_002483 [Zingiber officinale]|uniref:Uncharacterized protein n=1 Tax=Zingiber officinale TaxID=94328 RepID=A0A8J5LVY7_ZINOF|nr:hypothetical protein ZIOFF_002483 [Zingiber officinale]
MASVSAGMLIFELSACFLSVHMLNWNANGFDAVLDSVADMLRIWEFQCCSDFIFQVFSVTMVDLFLQMATGLGEISWFGCELLSPGVSKVNSKYSYVGMASVSFVLSAVTFLSNGTLIADMLRIWEFQSCSDFIFQVFSVTMVDLFLEMATGLGEISWFGCELLSPGVSKIG